MHKNLLLISWPYAKICYSLAEHARESFRRTKCTSTFFLSSSLSPIPLSPSPVLVRRTLSPLSHLRTFSHVFKLCLPIYVPCLMYLFLGYRPLSPVLRLCSLYTVLYPLSHGSAPGLPSSVPCLTWSAPCLPSSFLRPLTPINCPICSWHFWWLATSWYCTYLYVWLVGSG